jgi:hypothetical protein
MKSTLIIKTKNCFKNCSTFQNEKNPFIPLRVTTLPKLHLFITLHAKSNSLLIEAPKNDHRNEPANGREATESRVVVRP